MSLPTSHSSAHHGADGDLQRDIRSEYRMKIRQPKIGDRRGHASFLRVEGRASSGYSIFGAENRRKSHNVRASGRRQIEETFIFE